MPQRQKEKEKENILDEHHISHALKTQTQVKTTTTKDRNNPKHRETKKKSYKHILGIICFG